MLFNILKLHDTFVTRRLLAVGVALRAGGLAMCVLVVEDDALVREMVSEYLTLVGHPVLLARDGDEAIDLIKNPPRRFSVLVTDFHMPGNYHGGDVAAHMLVRHPHVHVFIATGRPDAAKRACRIDLPVTIIEKPYSLRTLLGHIQHLIEA